MQAESYSVSVGVVNPPILLSEWSVTTTPLSWLDYPPEVRKRTLEAAKRIPFKDSPRSKWEAKAVR